MKKLLIEGLLVGGFAIMTVCFGREAYTLAAAQLQEPVISAVPVEAMSTAEVLVICTVQPTSTPKVPVLTPVPRQVEPDPTPTPEWPALLEYDGYAGRYLARFRHSCVSDKATWPTQIASCEVVQNRTTQPGFPDTNKGVLLEPHEFDGFSTRGKLRSIDWLAADYAMRSFEEAKQGDYSHRYTPFTGVYLEFSADLQYCKVYDKEWRVVCDTSQFE